MKNFKGKNWKSVQGKKEEARRSSLKIQESGWSQVGKTRRDWLTKTSFGPRQVLAKSNTIQNFKLIYSEPAFSLFCLNFFDKIIIIRNYYQLLFFSIKFKKSLYTTGKLTK